ncbi:HCL407Wp [Eremothecium sinecaudum]|uniref:asparaginase n=1 Tax=Eremothecium sinecaudum TaxID=45286 RepID=A0A120K1U2_9SACH|nr:HCL407Wp [Eremothecium sinecaudum]AMD19744.1 HCL407Wp [Eremothecium sinecaudum]
MINPCAEVKTINDDIDCYQFAVQVPTPNKLVDSKDSAIDSSVLERSSFDPKYSNRKLPKIKILGTGGTIAAKGSSSSQTAGYQVDLTVAELLDAIPDFSSICEIYYEQLCNVDSKEINDDILLQIYEGITDSLQKFDGIVITHGTDTLSETAFFIESTIDSGDVPIVFVGSMRPSTSVSADGPMNLYQAICIAADPQSCGRGVLVSLNDQISAGYYITKTNANSLDSFNVRRGYLGNFVNNEVHYYYPPAKPHSCYKFKLYVNDETKKSLSLPKVAILYAHQSLEPELIKIVAAQYSGIVIATLGAGSLPAAVNDACLNLDIPVVYSKRAMDGMIPIANLPKPLPNKSYNLIASGYLNPEKSRILLQLCLREKFCFSDIKKVFRVVYGG